MKKTVTLIIALVACGVLGILLSSDASWARPKKSNEFLLCKCTCFARDAQGNDHWGNTGGVWYTTSGDACTKYITCKVGKLNGFANSCINHHVTDIKPGLQSAPPASTITR